MKSQSHHKCKEPFGHKTHGLQHPILLLSHLHIHCYNFCATSFPTRKLQYFFSIPESRKYPAVSQRSLVWERQGNSNWQVAGSLVRDLLPTHRSHSADPLVRGLPGLAGCEPRTGASFFVCLLHAHGIETVPGEHKATARLQRLAVYSAHSCVLFHLSLTQGLRLSWAGLGRAA